MIGTITFSDGSTKDCILSEIKNGNITTLTLSAADAENRSVSYVDVAAEYFTAKAGTEGYAVIPCDNRGTVLTYFSSREDDRLSSLGAVMHCFGIKRENKAELVIVRGCENDLKTVLELKDGVYRLIPRFDFDSSEVYEDISLDIYDLGDADYSDMARTYREYQINCKGCVPIKERIKTRKMLARNVESVEVRIRLGWKPAPSPYAVQTLANEPEMHTALTFDEVGELCDKLKEKGVEKAEICLVGWNVKGHDGRWPQCFPVEEALGGEAKLKELIKHVKGLGYSIVGHTNYRDMYKIADIWDDDDVAVKADGSIMEHPIYWSGGQPFVACPWASYEKFAKENLPRVASLGFEGLHYVDVLTVLPLHRCHSETHPASTKDTASCYGRIQSLSKDLIGGYASEGPYDFAAKDLDFALYTCFNLIDNKPSLCDEIIPFWQLCYHGIILSNPGTETVNYIVKKDVNKLKFIEYGGRPAAYIYSKFLANHDYEVDWMGSEDLTCRTEEETERTADAIKAMYDEYSALSSLQYEFMEKHEKLGEGVYRVTYSDGTKITVDYNAVSYTVEMR